MFSACFVPPGYIDIKGSFLEGFDCPGFATRYRNARGFLSFWVKEDSRFVEASKKVLV